MVGTFGGLARGSPGNHSPSEILVVNLLLGGNIKGNIANPSVARKTTA